MEANRSDLELPDDPDFQRVEWTAQRVAWWLWALIIAVALAGLLGPGPLSHTTARSEDGALAVSYDRFLHYHNPTQITLHFTHRDQGRDHAEVFIDRSLLCRFEVRRIDPKPISSQLSPAGVTHVFSVPSGVTDGEITYRMDFDKYGPATGQITLDGRSTVTLRLFVFP